jgi:adenosylcobinamide-GDP ribazoletransferase
MPLPPALRGVRAALTFLTQVPAGGFPYSPDDLRWSAAHFPLIGALLGAAQAAVYIAARPAGALPAAALAVASALLLTGAFHEDGLADTADALGGARDRARLFVILKDSRIGSFGAAALVLALLGRVTLVAQLDALAPVALVVTGSAARTPPTWLMAALRYVSDEATARSGRVVTSGPVQAAVATAWAGLSLFVPWQAGALSAAAVAGVAAAGVLLAALCAWRFVARAGGITGDFLGANEQLNECAMLLAIAWVRGHP